MNKSKFELIASHFYCVMYTIILTYFVQEKSMFRFLFYSFREFGKRVCCFYKIFFIVFFIIENYTKNLFLLFFRFRVFEMFFFSELKFFTVLSLVFESKNKKYKRNKKCLSICLLFLFIELMSLC